MPIYIGEFVGTFLLILFGGGVVAGAILKGTKSENAGYGLFRPGDWLSRSQSTQWARLAGLI